MTRSIHLDSPFGIDLPATPIVIHVQFAGQRFSIPLTSLDIGTATADAKVKRAVATRLLVTPDRLDGHVVDRHDTGDLTLRPEPCRVSNFEDFEPAPDENPGLVCWTTRSRSTRRPSREFIRRRICRR